MTYDNNDRQPATVIQTFTSEGFEFRLTAKSCVNVYALERGTFRYIHTLQAKSVKAHAQFGCPVMSVIVDSPEWANLNEQYLKSREVNKIQKQVAGLASKAMKLQQAAIDQLKASGMTEEQAKAILKIA